MSGLNYLRIAQILGGTLSERGGSVPSFGSIGSLQTASERFRLVRERRQESEIRPSQYAVIAKAFEAVRDGYEPDRVIVDPVLSKRFITECRHHGIDAAPAAIYKQLQSFRKASSYGIKLKKTTRAAGIEAEPFFYAAELGYVQLSYRSRASIDDIITEPEIGTEFTRICHTIAPGGTGMIFKWAALKLRKMRYFAKDKASQLLSIKAKEIEQKLKPMGTLDRAPLFDVPKSSGIFSLSELNGQSKYLYVGWGDNLRESIEPFSSAKPLLALAGRFWNPSASSISLSVGQLDKRWHGGSARDWALRLIRDRHPLLNIPVEMQNPVASPNQ